jgi:2-polyprenyl-3-methyl-5-hydroxy-6-metoxy-1,4-benzoquinol methylase
VDCCQTDGIEQEMDHALATRELRSYRRRGPASTTRILLDALREAGARDGTLLDIGGGVGAIQHAFLRAGCPEVISVDASSAYLEAAREEARRLGHLDRLRQHHGDFVQLADDLPGADVVTLDRVICCYHDMDNLVRLSAERAHDLYGLVYPRDRTVTKAFLWFENAYHAVRGSQFRAFVHATEAVDAVIRSLRFERVFARTTPLWQVHVYRRSRVARSSSS